MSRASVNREVEKVSVHWVLLAFLQSHQLEAQRTTTQTDGHRLLAPVLEATVDPA